MHPTIDGQEYDAVIVADGGWSTLRHYVNGNEKQPEYAGYVVYRTKLDAKHYPDFDGEGIYMTGKYFAIALNVPTCEGRKFIMGGVAIGAPESEVSRPVAGASRHADVVHAPPLPDWFMPFVRRTFAHHANGRVVKWLERCATEGKITPQPQYEFMAEKVVSGRVILMGDAAHMASPRTAVGAHTGILDAAGLMEAFGAHPGVGLVDRAIGAYAPGGARRARELYARTKEVSRPIAYAPGDRRPQE
jgi:2-polyprenyl-6-methoxyphenol hydroxylase-like FAD-dependent oxidoreductase